MVYRKIRNLIFSPMLVATLLGGFSTYLVSQGQVEAAMGGAGAAVAAATMKSSKESESEEELEKRIKAALRIRELELENKYMSELTEARWEMTALNTKLKTQEKELELKLLQEKINNERDALNAAKHELLALQKQHQQYKSLSEPDKSPEEHEAEEVLKQVREQLEEL